MEQQEVKKTDKNKIGGGKPGPGRPEGLPNKATMAARDAIAMFVTNNAHRLQEWLDAIAKGVKSKDGKFKVEPNPQKAFELFQSVIEYHVPKLARTENYNENRNINVEELPPMPDNVEAAQELWKKVKK